jgi:hypothetical protein
VSGTTRTRKAPMKNQTLANVAYWLFTILGIPLLIATPFALYGFLGRP